MQAYSLDLRRKIVETYETEEISQRALAERFRVAVSFVEKLLKQWRETKDLNPKPHGGGQTLKLSSEHIILIGDLVQEKPDITLNELKQLLEEKTKVQVSQSTISRVLKRLGFTKKKQCMPVSAIRIESKSGEETTGRPSKTLRQRI
jgi:transposase